MTIDDAQVDLEESDEGEALSDMEEAELEVPLSVASEGESSSSSRSESLQPAAQNQPADPYYLSPSGQVWFKDPPPRFGQRPA